MARPTRLLDDLVTKRIVDALCRGNGRTSAARLAGVAPSAFFDWLRRGRAGEALFAEFSERVKRAEAEFEDAALARIQKAADEGTWTAAAWLLERRNPRRWGRRDVRAELVTETERREAYERLPPDEKARVIERAEAKVRNAREKLEREVKGT